MSAYQERLSGVLGSYQAPEPLRAALEQQHQPDVAAGQLWRAQIHGTAVLVLIVSEFTQGSGETVVATPGETPPVDSDIDYLLERTDVFRRLTLWPILRGQLHQRVLDKLIEHSDTTTRLSAMLASRETAAEAPVHAHDPGAELIAELRDQFEALQAAPAVPRREASPPRLADLLPGDARTQLTAVMDLLAVPQHQAMELLRGQRELSDEQARALERRYELTTGGLPTAQGIQEDLALEVEHPRWREATRQRAHDLGVSEVEGRTSLAAEAYALAARESTSSPDWRQRLAT